ncbi:MAG: flagellar hook-length control protein FliK, partial [Caulobacteraceae bacterium]
SVSDASESEAGVQAVAQANVSGRSGSDGGDDAPDNSNTGDGGAGASSSASSSSASSGGGDAQIFGFAPVPLGFATDPDASTPDATSTSATAADLGSQMASRVSSGSSSFQLQLNPNGLGQVTVTVQIGADRQLTASLAFDHPESASALSAHSGELQKALEQSGFTVGSGGFTFTVHHADSTPQSADRSGGQTSGGFTPGGQNFGDSSESSRGGNVPMRLARGAFVSSDNLQDPVTPRAWGQGGADSRLDIRI